MKSKSSLSQSMYKQPQAGNQAMVRSSLLLAGGLDHLFSLGDNPLASFRDTSTCAEVLEDSGMCWSEDGINDELNKQVVE
jgi:hypothetical protein